MERKINAPDAAIGDLFGFSVAVDGDLMVVGAAYDTIETNVAQGSVYVYERRGVSNTWEMVRKLTLPDGHEYDFFGQAVAVAGDVVAVGAPFHDGVHTNVGAAFVFERDAGGSNAWGLVTTLTPALQFGECQFGSSIAAAGDVVVVGVPFADTLFQSDRGMAYVYERNQDGINQWDLVETLTTPTALTNSWFGMSVAVDGDVIVASAPGVHHMEGAAYVFERDAGGTGNWGQVRELIASDGLPDQAFGSSVDVAGDVIAVGSYRDSAAGHNHQGSVFVFERNLGGTNRWGEVTKLTASDGAADDFLGTSVAVVGDLIMAGAPYVDLDPSTSGDDHGSVYVFDRDHGGPNKWTEVKKLTPSDAPAGAWFGHCVAAAGDQIAVGAHLEGMGRGAIYVFPKRAASWDQMDPLIAADGTANDLFGCSVAVAGDVLVVGVSNRNAAYVFERNQNGANGWGSVRKLTGPDGTDSAFGSSVAANGDVIVVGAPHASDDRGAAYIFERNHGGTNAWGQAVKQTNVWSINFGEAVAVEGDVVVVGNVFDLESTAGAAYVFERNAGGAGAWGEVAKLMPVNGPPYDQLGTAVAVGGDVIVIGLKWAQVDGNAMQGSAFVFERNSGGTNAWGKVRQLTASDGAGYDQFGISVAVAGDTIVVGASWQNIMQGAAYLYERNAGGANAWDQTRKLTAPDGFYYEEFGASVAAAGDVIVAGFPLDEVSGATNRGSACVFERNLGGTNAWGCVGKLTASDGAPSDLFGSAVAAGGDLIAVGAPGHAVGGSTNQGGVYLYVGSHYPVPIITSAACAEGANAILCWRSANALAYDVQACTSLAPGAWANLPGCTNLCATGETMVITNSAAGTHVRFYRIGVAP